MNIQIAATQFKAGRRQGPQWSDTGCQPHFLQDGQRGHDRCSAGQRWRQATLYVLLALCFIKATHSFTWYRGCWTVFSVQVFSTVLFWQRFKCCRVFAHGRYFWDLRWRRKLLLVSSLLRDTHGTCLQGIDTSLDSLWIRFFNIQCLKITREDSECCSHSTGVNASITTQEEISPPNCNSRNLPLEMKGASGIHCGVLSSHPTVFVLSSI